MNIEYTKIETVFARDANTKKLNENTFRDETIEYLKNNDWEFTEKIDGTNIRVYWDGHNVSFYGRTEKSQIPTELLEKLNTLFGGNINEEMFEQKFGEKPVLLFGEGYGGKIQNGGSYKKDCDFILFDVFIGGNYQSRQTVKEIAEYFNIDIVPTIMIGKLQDGIDYVKTNPISTIGTHPMEGLVGRPIQELKNRCGHRVIVKIKACDF